MKKWSMLMLFLFMNSSSVFADEMPVDQVIRDRFPGAQSCRFVNGFNNRFDCGEKRGEVWSCRYQGRRTDFLVNGTIDSDTGGSCSPTFVVDDVLKAE